MQAFTCMHNVKTAPAPARDRLLAAATRIFARDGLNGATTREIAREAGVNEVTLFRLFESKERLLEAVVQQNFGPDAPAPSVPIPAPTADFAADLLAHGRTYEKLLHENLPLIRAMLGEIHHHHRVSQQQVFRGIFRPLRTALVARLELAQTAGELRADVLPALLADLFGGMIFTGVLSRASHVPKDYSSAEHLAAAVDLIVRGAAA